MNLYTDIDPKCCAWTQELINANLIPPGDVLCKSIIDIKPHELEKYTQIHLFCGINGWSLALRLAGWPEDRPVWTSSLPCQSFSSAGKGKGFGDDRGNLWFPFLRLVRELRPGIIVGEQVQAAIGHGWLDRIFTDLEAETYACGACVLGAHSAGAPHIRQRLFWLAYSGSARTDICTEKVRARDDSAGEPSTDRRLADAEEQRSKWPVRTRNGRQGSPDDGAASRLENSQCDGWRERATSGPGQESGSTLTDDRGAASGMGHAPCQRRQNENKQSRNGGKAPGKREATEHRDDGSLNHWANSRWHACRDGKARRIPVEPALFPLAHGIPGRVGLLRGAGNAITPQVAAEFVKAAAEAIDSLRPAASASGSAEPL